MRLGNMEGWRLTCYLFASLRGANYTIYFFRIWFFFVFCGRSIRRVWSVTIRKTCSQFKYQQHDFTKQSLSTAPAPVSLRHQSWQKLSYNTTAMKRTRVVDDRAPNTTIPRPHSSDGIWSWSRPPNVKLLCPFLIYLLMRISISIT